MAAPSEEILPVIVFVGNVKGDRYDRCDLFTAMPSMTSSLAAAAL